MQEPVQMRAEDFLQMKPQEVPEPDAARAAVLADEATEDGIHDLKPFGPWPAAGSMPPVNGRVPGVWGCSRCGKTAADTSRVCQAVRLPCGQPAWQAAGDVHDLAEENGGTRCSRCRLGVAPHHVWQSERQRCPVPVLTRQGERWQAGEASIRAVLGRVRAYRRWCCPEAAGEADGDAEGAGGGAGAAVGGASEGLPLRKRRREEVRFVQAEPLPMTLQPYVGHLAVKVGRSLWCLRCFETPGGDFRAWRHGRCEVERPPHAMPPGLQAELARARPLGEGLAEAVRGRWQVLATAARSAPPRPVCEGSVRGRFACNAP